MLHNLVYFLKKQFHNNIHEEKNPQGNQELNPCAPIIIEYGYGLASLVDEEGGDSLVGRIDSIRQHYIEELEVVIPTILFRKSECLHPYEYEFVFGGERMGDQPLLLDHYLAIPQDNIVKEIDGIPTFEPCFHCRALWITEKQYEKAKQRGYIVEDLATIIEKHFSKELHDYLVRSLRLLVRDQTGKPLICKGLFWITNMDSIENNSVLFWKNPDCVDGLDDSIEGTNQTQIAKRDYDFKEIWMHLATEETGNKEYNYYPRGRVEISGDKAIIFATPSICTLEIMEDVQKKYMLTDDEGIHTVLIVQDESEEYICYQDK